jgi:hypothetical protein
MISNSQNYEATSTTTKSHAVKRTFKQLQIPIF